MVANPEEDELSLLIGLLTLGIGKEIGGDGSVSNYDQRLMTMRDKVRSAILLPKLKLSVIKSLSVIQHKVCQHSEFFLSQNFATWRIPDRNVSAEATGRGYSGSDR